MGRVHERTRELHTGVFVMITPVSYLLCFVLLMSWKVLVLANFPRGLKSRRKRGSCEMIEVTKRARRSIVSFGLFTEEPH